MNEWKTLFTNLDDVFANIGSLLLDSERMLAARRFVIDHNTKSAIGAQQSYNVHSPGWWYPGWISRHFRAETGGGGSLPFVCVLLHRRPGDDFEPLDNPVVSAGVLRLPEGVEWAYWMAKAWAWSQERRTDGAPVVVPFKDGGAAEVLAVPLTSISSASALERQLIEPLVKLSNPDGSP